MAEPNQDPNQQERDRRLKNLNALFAWASAHGTHGEDVGSAYDAMSKERQDFLNDAIKSMTVDVVEEIQRCVNALRLEDDAAEAAESKVDAMETLLDFIEDLNFATDFQKMGGLELLMYALDSAHDDVVWRAGECLATAVQNDAKLQLYVLDLGAMNKLLSLLDDTDNEKVVLKMLRALSCLSAANVRVIESFLAADGLKTITATMTKHSGSAKVLIKTAFFVAGLPEHYPQFGRVAADAGLIGVFAAAVKQSNENMLWECVLRLMANLCTTHTRCIARLQDEDLNAKGLLSARASYIEALDAEDRPGHTEEEAYIAKLRTFLETDVSGNNDDSNTQGGADVPASQMQLLAVDPASNIGSQSPESIASMVSANSNASKTEFEATADWQPVHDNHILPAGLDVKIDLKTGAKYARLTSR